MSYESLDPNYDMDSFLADGRYFQSRLAITKRAAELPASAQFDLARSSLSDDQLENVAGQFGGPSPAGANDPGGHSNGFGFSAVFDDLLNRNPRSVPVVDLRQLQTNLVARGFVSPDTEVDGVWGSEWSSAFNRFDATQYQSMVAGQHVGASPVSAALGVVTNTLPSRVFSGIIAQAKSLVTEAGPSLEHGGLLGGAAEGVAIGAAAGLVTGPASPITVPVGALVGGIIGGIAGFFADLTGDDKNEPVDQSLMGNFLDSLSPYEEYVQSPEGAKNFFHDIGWVANASSAVLGAGAIGTGLKAARAAVGTARVGSMGAAELAAPELAGATSEATAGAWARGIPSAVQPAAVTAPTALEAGTKTTLQALVSKAAPAESGVFTRMAAWSMRRATFEDGAQTLVDFMGKYGPRAQMSRPVMQGARSVFSGVSESQLGARYTAGLGAGSGSLNREIAGFEEQLRENVDEKGKPLDPRVRPAIEQRLAELKQTRDQSETPTEKAFRTAPEIPGAFYVDQLAWILYPEHFFPLRVGGADGVMAKINATASDASLLSYGKIVRRMSPTPMSHSSSITEGRAALGDTPLEQSMLDTTLRRNYGVDEKASELVAGLTPVPSEGAARLSSLKVARSKVIRDVQTQSAAGDVELAAGLVQRSVDNPDLYEAWLMDKMSHTGVGGLRSYVQAEKVAMEASAAAQEALLPKGLEASVNWEKEALQSRIEEIDTRASQLQKKARSVLDPKEKVAYEASAEGLRTQAETLREELKVLPKTARTEPKTISAMRIDNMTGGELGGKRKELTALRDQLKAIEEPVADVPREAVLAKEALLQNQVLEIVDDLAKRGVIYPRLAIELRNDFSLTKVAQVVKELGISAKHTATDARDLVGPKVTQELEALGYKPVVVAGDMLFVHDVQKFGKLIPTTYSKQARIVDFLGLRKVTNEGIGRIIKAQEESELNLVLGQFEAEGKNITMTGKGLRGYLASKIQEIAKNSPKMSLGALSVGKRVPQALGDLSVREIEEVFSNVEGFGTAEAIRVSHAIKRGQAFGGELKLLHPIESARDIGGAINANGLPGFSALVRTYHLNPKWTMGTGAAVGAGLGFVGTPGDIEKKFEGALKYAIAGGVTGGGLAALAFMRGGYGYLPDRLAKLNNYLRYTLSATFDAGRYVEQNLIAKAKEPGRVSMFFRPEKALERQGEMLSPFSGTMVGGEQLKQETWAFWDELNGGVEGYISVRAIDDLERRFSQVGILGFDPRKFEAVQAMMLYNSLGGKIGKKALLDRVLELGRYGPGQTNIEKSLNFIFFPFMYSKKIVMTAGDFMLQAPGRALLLHEGMKAYDASKYDEDFHRVVEDKLPILKEMAQISNFGVYGLSPGRFFLQGLGGRDTRTTEARVMQGLASFFVPSGAAEPLARVAGQAGDLAMHMFTPTAFTGGSFQRAGGFDGMQQILRSYVPSIRDVTQWYTAIKASAVGLMHGEVPYAQLQDYQDGLHAVDSHQELIAKAMGYADASGLRSSAAGAMFQRQYDETKAELQKKYPQGAAIAGSFVGSDATRDVDLRALAEKAAHDSPEELIVRMAADEASTKRTAELLGMPASFVTRMLTQRLRALALQHVDDPRFLELYDTFFAYTYGPISRIATAA